MIHVLGAGNIGALIASKLAPKYSISLILKPSAARAFKLANQSISLTASGIEHEVQVEQDTGGPISSLIVALKCYNIRKALESIKDRISPTTSILCIHNGMGVYDELLELWPDSDKRPSLAFGVTSSGVKNREKPFHFEAVGLGPFFMGAPGNVDTSNSAMNAMVDSQSFAAGVQLNFQEFQCRQLEKVVINAVINPLTALIDCPNGALLKLDVGIIRTLVNEACYALGSDAVTRAVLDPGRMLDVVLDVCARTASNTSSMRADVNHGRPTEVQYINGFVARKARQLDRRAPRHELLASLVNMAMKQNKYILNDVLVPFRD